MDTDGKDPYIYNGDSTGNSVHDVSTTAEERECVLPYGYVEKGKDNVP